MQEEQQAKEDYKVDCIHFNQPFPYFPSKNSENIYRRRKYYINSHLQFNLRFLLNIHLTIPLLEQFTLTPTKGFSIITFILPRPILKESTNQTITNSCYTHTIAIELTTLENKTNHLIIYDPLTTILSASKHYFQKHTFHRLLKQLYTDLFNSFPQFNHIHYFKRPSNVINHFFNSLDTYNNIGELVQKNYLTTANGKIQLEMLKYLHLQNLTNTHAFFFDNPQEAIDI
jgi:hypothetical protein